MLPMDDMVCLKHRKTASHTPEPGEMCEWLPVEGIVGVRISYEVTCMLHPDLQGGHYGSMDAALQDRDAHIRSHSGGKYG